MTLETVAELEFSDVTNGSIGGARLRPVHALCQLVASLLAHSHLFLYVFLEPFAVLFVLLLDFSSSVVNAPSELSLR